MMRDFSTTWFRYFFSSHAKLFLGCFLLLFFLFVVTDLMIHVKDILNPDTDTILWVQYYAAMFSKRFDTLIPFSLLTSSTILFSSLSKKNEQIPLLNGGLSMKRQVMPFFTVALLAMVSMWLNSQYLFPKAIQRHEYITETAFGKDRENGLEWQKRMGTLYLNDGSKLFFLQNDSSSKQLFDVFWLRDQGTILHMETLSYATPTAHRATLVDILQRDSSGIVKKTETLASKEITDLCFSEEDVRLASHPARYLSISELFTMVHRMGRSSSEKSSDIFITLLSKLLSPIICLLTVSVPLFSCLTFNRERHPVILLLFFIALLFIFQLFVHTTTVLARIPNMPSFLLLLFPWAASGALCYRKLKRFFACS